MDTLLALLQGSDRRSVGRVAEVVAAVLAEPSRLSEVFEGVLSEDPVIRMRAADAVEKITACRPDLLQPYKARVLREMAPSSQPEVRWHAAQLFGRLALTARERRAVYARLQTYLTDDSRIVKTFAMQALADLAGQMPDLRPAILRQLEALTQTGTSAMRSRGRKLIARLTAGH